MIWILLFPYSVFAANIGLLIMATGKYDKYAETLITSSKKYFCKEHQVTYFVFTDSKTIQQSDSTVVISQKRLGWPFDTMMRNQIYANHESLYQSMDYLFATDADMLFVDTVGNEILSQRVATLHPGFLFHEGPYERNLESTAYVSFDEGEHYYAGGFFGGTRDEFMKIVQTTSKHVQEDLSKDIIAVWHDESHWNRYCIDTPPTLILSPSYCWPENCDWFDGSEFPPKLIALDKNHQELRNSP